MFEDELKNMSYCLKFFDRLQPNKKKLKKNTFFNVLLFGYLQDKIILY